ncbi:MAG: thioredoxin family protein [Verrucomicrobiota bacterium]
MASRLKGSACFSALVLFGSAPALAQEGLRPDGEVTVPAQSDGSGVRAQPVPQAIPFATSTGEPGVPSAAVPPSGPAPGPTSKPAQPTGLTVSAEQTRSRVIERVRPERVQVYPEDPGSAWWEINPHYAFARAQREQRPLMLLFTGMWNTQAMALSEEVFSTKSFNEYVKENLVICYLNYPRNFTDAPDALRRIKEKFNVRGYPNVLIFNPSGEVEKGIRGYHTGRPVDYFNQLKGHCLPVLESIEARKNELIRHGFRDWSNFVGKEIFARFVEHDTVRVVLQDVSGFKWTIAIKDLGEEDQHLVMSFPRVNVVNMGEDEK